VIVLVVTRLLYYASEARRAQFRALGARMIDIGAPALPAEAGP